MRQEKPLSDGRAFSILLGAIGGDSHSVGLHILRSALIRAGYHVSYLGIQNRFEDLLANVSGHDVAMISNMDGHAALYLEGVSRGLLWESAPGVLFYLGGNISLGDKEGDRRRFLNLGFDRVWAEFVDVDVVLETLAKDLAGRPTAERRLPPKRLVRSGTRVFPQPPAKFEDERADVLTAWPTGKAASQLDRNAEFLSRHPLLACAQRQAEAARGKALLQPRSGVAEVPAQIGLLCEYAREGAAALSLQVDSLTRNNDYETAARALERGVEINGFPVVNHGVEALRQVVHQVGLPVQTRHSTRDPRLLADISYAGGVTAFEGGPICYNIPYYKDHSLRDSFRLWKYVDTLTGLYYERYHLRLDREFFGTLTATLLPPCIAITCNVLESLAAARQGVKCVSLAYAEQGNRSQDVAALRSLPVIAREYLARAGYDDVWVHTVFHQYMAGFPPGLDQAEALIRNSAVTAVLGGASRIVVKSPVECRAIPKAADNVRGLRLAALGVADAVTADCGENQVAQEQEHILREVRCLLSAIIDQPSGDMEENIIQAFARGHMDIPFAPSVYNAGLAVTIRDCEGAIRFLDCGNLPFDRDTRLFHADCVERRRKAERRGYGAACDYAMVESDVLLVPRGLHAGWPLDHRPRPLP